jgi:hypothetical protein
MNLKALWRKRSVADFKVCRVCLEGLRNTINFRVVGAPSEVGTEHIIIWVRSVTA